MAKFFILLASLALVAAVFAQDQAPSDSGNSNNPLITGANSLWGLLAGLGSLLLGPSSVVAWLLEGVRYLVAGIVVGVNWFLDLKIGQNILLLVGRLLTGLANLFGTLIFGFQGPSA